MQYDYKTFGVKGRTVDQLTEKEAKDELCELMNFVKTFLDSWDSQPKPVDYVAVDQCPDCGFPEHTGRCR